MSGVRREHFTQAEKPKRIEDMIRERDEEIEPLKPIEEVVERVERARIALLEAAKIADGIGAAIHMPVQAVRLDVERCQSELTSWTARDE